MIRLLLVISVDVCLRRGGGNSLCPYSQQRPIVTNLSLCLGLSDNGQQKSTNRLVPLVPHGRPHGIMRFLEILCMPKLKALKMRATKADGLKP